MNIILQRFMIRFFQVIVTAIAFGIHPIVGLAVVCGWIALWLLAQESSGTPTRPPGPAIRPQGPAIRPQGPAIPPPSPNPWPGAGVSQPPAGPTVGDEDVGYDPR